MFILLLLSSACWACGSHGAVSPPPVDQHERPLGYDLLFQESVCRWDLADFPLEVYIDDAPAEAGPFGQAMNAAAESSLKVWNGIVPAVPDFFSRTTDPIECDVRIRWWYDVKRGYTEVIQHRDRISIHFVLIDRELRDPAAIKALLSHELGHVLGLGHSNVKGDLMYQTVFPGEPVPSRRDRDMLIWLYNRDSYVPIRSR